MTQVAEDERWSPGLGVSPAGCSGGAQQVIRVCIQSPGDPLLAQVLGQSRHLLDPQCIPRKEPDSNAHLLAYQGLHPNAQNRACLLSGPGEHLRKDETPGVVHTPVRTSTVAVARPSGQRVQVGRGPSGEADRSPVSAPRALILPPPPPHPSRLCAASPGGGLGFHPSLRLLPQPQPASGCGGKFGLLYRPQLPPTALLGAAGPVLRFSSPTQPCWLGAHLNLGASGAQPGLASRMQPMGAATCWMILDKSLCLSEGSASCM